jgi:hypothetical protein
MSGSLNLRFRQKILKFSLKTVKIEMEMEMVMVMEMEM